MVRALALSILLTASVAAAPRESLRDAERRRAMDTQAEALATQRARTAAADEQRLAQDRVQSAGRLRTTEAALADLTDRLDALRIRREAADAQLRATVDSVAPMLPVFARLQRFPAETLLAVPLAPDDAVRGLIALRGLTVQLAQHAAQLREEQATVARLQSEIETALPALHAAESAQRTQAAELDEQLARARGQRTQAEDAAAEAAQRAATNAARAESVRAMLSQLDNARRAAEARAQAEAAQAARQRREADAATARQRHDEIARPAGRGVAENQLAVPVAGSLIRGWGEPTDSGPANGVSYRAPAGGRVVSPCAGRVAFAGPFRSYGTMAIVDCGGGFHAVLAGLDRLDVGVGRAVLSGEPIGVMPGGRPLLYVELRRDGQAVNPAPFLQARAIPS